MPYRKRKSARPSTATPSTPVLVREPTPPHRDHVIPSVVTMPGGYSGIKIPISSELMQRYMSWLRSLKEEEDMDLDHELDFERYRGDTTSLIHDKTRVIWTDLQPHAQYDWQQLRLGEMGYEAAFIGKLYVNKKMLWTGKTHQGLYFNLPAFEDEIQEALSTFKCEVIDQRTVCVRSSHAQGKKVHLIIQDFSSSEWAKIEDVITEQWDRYFRKVDVLVEIKCSIPLEKTVGRTVGKRARESTQIPELISSSPTSEPRARKTRTNTQVDLLASRSEQREQEGVLGEQLYKQWRCIKTGCRNNTSYCWVNEEDGQHYTISSLQCRTWSAKIAVGRATLECPPADLVNTWILKQGPAGLENKRPIEKETRSKIDQILDSYMKMAELQMTQKMAESMSNMGAGSASSQPSYYLPPPPPPIWASQSPYPPYPPYHNVSPIHQYSPFPAPPNLAPNLAPRMPVVVPALVPDLVPDLVLPEGQKEKEKERTPRSSPIIVDPAEEDDVISAFFKWKLLRTKVAAKQGTIYKVQDLVVQECWTLRDLIMMSDPQSGIYKIAVSYGVPEGMARRFAEELKLFKQPYRETNLLMGIRSVGS